jgi:flagellar assembly factor FliW
MVSEFHYDRYARSGAAPAIKFPPRAADPSLGQNSMPVARTTSFGQVSYDAGAVIEFPRGLPGFDRRRRFLAVRFPDSDPLVFLQSLEDAALCFITLPVLAIEPRYRLEVSAEDLVLVALPEGRRPRIGEDVLCLAVISIHPEGPTANLLAPVVVNLQNRRAVQAVAPEPRYSHRQPLGQEAAVCS